MLAVGDETRAKRVRGTYGTDAHTNGATAVAKGPKTSVATVVAPFVCASVPWVPRFARHPRLASVVASPLIPILEIKFIFGTYLAHHL